MPQIESKQPTVQQPIFAPPSPSMTMLSNETVNQSQDSNNTSDLLDDGQTSQDVTNNNDGQTSQDVTNNNCVDLTVAFLPSWIEDAYPVQLSLTSIDETIWSKNYSNVELFNTIVIDNVSDAGTCLSPGSYTFNLDVVGEAHYIMYSEGQVVSCGGVLKGGYNSTITLPFESSEIDPECSALINCPPGSQDSCLKQAFLPLQCYNNGTEVDVTAADYYSQGNRTMWFSDTCSEVLGQVCQSGGALGFRIGVESGLLQDRSVILESFCPYFECASTTFIDYIAGSGTLDEYYGCECKYTQWTCARAGAKCDAQTCCEDNEVASTALSTGCSCRIEPDCDTGNTEMCGVALSHCCATKEDETEKSDCENKYSRLKCEVTIEANELDENGDYSYCKQNSEAVCESDADEAGCQCKYWEEL
jgi:hypothetical protein